MKRGLWRFRVGNYRIVSELRRNELLVLVVQVGHRKDIYD
jgi:mRNA interferase RelE/StbE